MAPVTQEHDHFMQPIKGYLAQFPCLDRSAPLDETALETYKAWPAGRVGYITSSGTIALADGSTLTTQMPLYLWQSGTSWEVLSRGVGVDGKVLWQNSMPAGVVNGLVATGGYEIQTTEFDADQSYLPNTFLTATTDDDGVPGLLVPITGQVSANWVCGVASLHCQERWDLQTTPTSAKGVAANGKAVLTFWSYFLPKTTGGS